MGGSAATIGSLSPIPKGPPAYFNAVLAAASETDAVPFKAMSAEESPTRTPKFPGSNLPSFRRRNVVISKCARVKRSRRNPWAVPI